MATATSTGEHVTTKAKTNGNGVQAALSAQELEQAGIQPGEDVVLEVRRYTAEDWFAEGEGRVFAGEELIEYLEACPDDEQDS